VLIPIIFYVLSLIITGLVCAGLYRWQVLNKYFASVINTVLSILLFVFIIIKYQGFQDESISLSWPLPFADFNIGLDYLSLFFIIPLLILAAGCSIYGSQYFKQHRAGRFHWFNYGLLVAGMMMVLVSRNVVIFMISWEIMSLSSFFLVISEAGKASVRRAGWIYFITAHVGTAFLFTAFFLLGSGSGSFDFGCFGQIPFSGSKSNLIFIFALTGFGLKAGFIPFHIWLPLAHPAAPSHVSGLMSGIMIKMGIYGILRVMLFIGPFHPWWGVLLIILGSISAIGGILFSIGQRDIKRILAYCSVENIGIILIGLGIGIAGRSLGYPVVSMFGFAGALLHIVNHALFKGLLFLGAGAVIRQTGTGEIDKLGGLFKKMPLTASLFLLGSIAISGLPFFNGFISELFIYAGAITGASAAGGTVLPLLSALAVLSLALTGGLAVAGFTKLFGILFQGTSRNLDISGVKDVPSMMRHGMIFLTLFVVFIGMVSFLIIPFIESPMLLFTGGTAESHLHRLNELSVKVSIILAVTLSSIILLFAAGRLRAGRKTVKKGETWGCGYTVPARSMQYTSSSYAGSIVDRFGRLVAVEKVLKSEEEIFPVSSWSFKSKVDDWFLSRIYTGIIRTFDRLLACLRWFQCGKAGIYVLYIAVFIIILIFWKFGI